MCGYRCATDGCYQANRLRFDWRLAFCILVSLMGHGAIVVLPFANGGASMGSREGMPGRASLLQVKLTPYFVGPEARVSLAASADSARRKNPLAEKQGLRSFFPEVSQDQLPEPLTELELSFDDPRLVGFMILFLRIDRAGAVVASEVMYTNLPSDVRDKIVLSFSSMRFKPGRRGGEPDDASVLLRVDVD